MRRSASCCTNTNGPTDLKAALRESARPSAVNRGSTPLLEIVRQHSLAAAEVSRGHWRNARQALTRGVLRQEYGRVSSAVITCAPLCPISDPGS
jgi:hypothetical protein